MIRKLSVSFFCAAMLWGLPAAAAPAGLSVETSEEGLLVREGDTPVLFYRRLANASDSLRVHYVHPVYTLDGRVLTEDAPEDHPHHRGINWVWPNLLLDGKRVADPWKVHDIRWDILRADQGPDQDEGVELRIVADWYALGAANPDVSKPLLHEATHIAVGPMHDHYRAVRFAIELTALRDGVALSGAQDQNKGYGGFSIRLADPTHLVFRSAKGPVVPQVAAVPVEKWLDATWTAGPFADGTGVSIVCRAEGALWEKWVLRNELSMQSCAFPGVVPVTLAREHMLTLGATVFVREKGGWDAVRKALRQETRK